MTQTRTLTFPAESVTASATVTTREDDTQEGPESFTAILSDPTNGLSLGTTTSAIVDITDDDGKSSSFNKSFLWYLHVFMYHTRN